MLSSIQSGYKVHVVLAIIFSLLITGIALYAFGAKTLLGNQFFYVLYMSQPAYTVMDVFTWASMAASSSICFLVFNNAGTGTSPKPFWLSVIGASGLLSSAVIYLMLIDIVNNAPYIIERMNEHVLRMIFDVVILSTHAIAFYTESKRAEFSKLHSILKIQIETMEANKAPAATVKLLKSIHGDINPKSGVDYKKSFFDLKHLVINNDRIIQKYH